VGQFVSAIGAWMQSTAQGYLVYELTRSPAFLGYVGFAAGLPSWLFTLFGGVVADRVPRRLMLVFTQSMMMVLALVLAALVFSGKVMAWHILVMAFLLGIANAFDAPARQAFVVELVPEENRSNAIALNSTMFNSATIIGPAVAGIVYAQFGPAFCFAINGLSFVAVLFALMLMRLPRFERKPATEPVVAQLVEGVRFAFSHSIIRVLILNMTMVSVFGMSVMTLLPAWSVDVLGGDVGTNSVLLSSRGAGALIGAITIAYLSGQGLQGKVWTTGSLLMPVSLLLFSFSRSIPLAMAFMVVLGLSFMTQANTSNSLIQSLVPDNLRGRVMSIYTLTIFGGNPLGALWVGLMAAAIGEPRTLLINAAALMSFALLVFLRIPRMRALK